MKDKNILSSHEDILIADMGVAQKFKFMLHRNKGDWAFKSTNKLHSELKREIEELDETLSLFYAGDASKEDVISECADIANYLAMIIEKVRK